MKNIVDIHYQQTGKSKNTNELGMREMQAKAFEKRNSQYLLLKSPPASGKSRALMFNALDKLEKQGLEKVIVAVPERSIGGSFDSTELKKYGYYYNWTVDTKYNLCTPGGGESKVQSFLAFMQSSSKIMICTHATLRFASQQIPASDFNNCLLAIDEFHHVSSSEDSKLGELLKVVIKESTAHILAMTGSYFRGDSAPVMMPEDEEKFDTMTYSYYDQLNGYEYLKSLGIGYHFYNGRYTDAIGEVLDPTKKTIIHIPSPNATESTKDKRAEVDYIIDTLGEVLSQDKDTGVYFVKCKKTGKILKVADLVEDDEKRTIILNYLRTIKSEDEMDIIIALGMAKEGFDWSFCEHALTVGYRGSLTEIIQIIGRCTRDSSNKSHAQFTNLVAEPDAENDEVNIAVNNMLKAITLSLLMEQVMAPVFKYKPKVIVDKDAHDNLENENEDEDDGVIHVKGLPNITSKKVRSIIENDLNDLKAIFLQSPEIQKSIIGDMDPEVTKKVIIPKILRTKYPDLDTEEIECLRKYVITDTTVKSAWAEYNTSNKFITMTKRFINVAKLDIDLIDKINLFQKAYEVISKNVTTDLLSLIHGSIKAPQMSVEEVEILYPKIKEYIKTQGRKPSSKSNDPLEVRMASAIEFIKRERAKREAEGKQ